MQPPRSILQRRRCGSDQLYDDEVADRLPWSGDSSLRLQYLRPHPMVMMTMSQPSPQATSHWHSPSFSQRSSSLSSLSPLPLPSYQSIRRSAIEPGSPPIDAEVLPAMSTILRSAYGTASSPLWPPSCPLRAARALHIPVSTSQHWGFDPIDRQSSQHFHAFELSCSSPSNQSTASGHDDNHDDHPQSSKGDSPSGGSAERKASRYLREMDRRAILERLARGEKQATLAKEYHVSRAAICNLFKHRDEVMSRTDEDPFAKHPKKRKHAAKRLRNKRSRSLKLATVAGEAFGGAVRSVVTQPATPSRVDLVQTDAVLLLLTAMSDSCTSADAFRRASERVLWLLIEEAMATVPIQAEQIPACDGVVLNGVVPEHPPCAISLEQTRTPMLDIFQLLEPERPFGRITGSRDLVLHDARLPETLKYHNVFLVDIAILALDALRSMVEMVKTRGALEVQIYVVALFMSAEAVAMLQLEYPHVHVVTTQIESHILEREKLRRSCVDVVLGRFDRVYETQYTEV